ncbi:MAG TPA: S-layer homology domain-containing protein [Acidimicrobiales bacterium]|nr:S-layer homology domain-containing protein [Acidimicrobiales bacterium]
MRGVTAAITATLVLTSVALPASAEDEAVPRTTTEACEVAGTSSFADRPDGATGEAVDCVAFYGITRGATNSHYAPELTVIRGQMASFLVRSMRVGGAAVPEPRSPYGFDDIASSVHADAIDQLGQTGVTTGTGPRTFHPDLEVTREQMASFVARAIEVIAAAPLPEPAGPAFDDVSGTHARRIDQLAELGVVVGVAPHRYAPGALVTRGQMALFLARALDALTEDMAVDLARTGVTATLASPELMGVERAQPTEDGRPRLVYAFDQEVSPTLVSSRFRAYTFAAEQVRAEEVARGITDRRQVVATFAAADTEAIRLATTATVARNAVQDEVGHLGPEGSAGIGALTLVSGTTTAPDLAAVVGVVEGSADFVFDQAATSLRADRYRVILDDGRVVIGTLVSGSGTAVHRVTLALTAEDAAEVKRGYVQTLAVEAAGGGDTNPQQAAPAVGAGHTMGPDLVTVAIDEGRDVVRFTFDEAIVVPSSTEPEAAWRVYALDGSEVRSAEAQPVAGDNRAADVTFPEGSIDHLTQGASVEPGVVWSAARPELTNQVDELGRTAHFASGQTAAPTLVRVGRVQRPVGDGASERLLVYRFDRPVVLLAEAVLTVDDADAVPHVLAGCTVAGGTPHQVICAANSATDPVAYAAMGTARRGAIAAGSVTGIGNQAAYRNHESSLPL